MGGVWDVWGEYEWQIYNVGSAPGGFIFVESGAAALPWVLSFTAVKLEHVMETL